MSGASIMAVVAAALAIGAVVLGLKAGGQEKAAVRRRIAATMLGAGAILLAAYAYVLHGWDSGQ